MKGRIDITPPRVGLALAALLALLLVSALAAQQSGSGHSGQAKSNKKHVHATLLDVPATPATPTPPATATPPASAAPAAPAAKAPTATPTPTAAGTAGGTASNASSTEPSTTHPSSGAAADLRPGAKAPNDTPSFEERIQVTEVQLDAIVKDGDKVVTGLGPDDFVVTEEGKPVEVTSVRFYGAPEELESTGEGDVARADRYFIFLFHDRSRDASFVRPLLLDAGRQARAWVEDQRLPNDQVAVMTYDVRLKIYTDFTRDKDQILDAISHAIVGKKEPDRRPGHSKEPLHAMAESPSLLLNLPAGEELDKQSNVFEKAVALLGRAAAGIVGRKNLLLFSVGFGDTDPNGVWVPDVRYYPDLERSLNDGNVAVYGIDLAGRGRGGPAGPGISSSLASIASDTAGLYYETFTNFMTPIKEVSKDTAGYYLISYRSQYERGTKGYRDVKVDTRQKGYQVRARQGYLFGAENQPVEIPDHETEPRAPRREPPTG